jgi:hypothetical protein
MTDASLSIAPTDHEVPKLVWVSLAMLLLQLPVGLIDIFFFQPIEIGIFYLVVIVVATLVSLGLIALLAFGYGWVRHLYVVGTVMALPQVVLSLAQRFHSSPMHGAWVVAANLWFYSALALLYSPPARAWFRDARLRRQRGI